MKFQGLTSCEHQHDNRARQVFAQENRGNHRNPSEQVRTKFPLQELPQQVIEERDTAENERG